MINVVRYLEDQTFFVYPESSSKHNGKHIWLNKSRDFLIHKVIKCK